jgi:ribosomal protein L37E
MSESNSANMICPKCGQFQENADTCKACGIVIAKVRTEQTITQTQTGNAAPEGIQIKDGTIREKTGMQGPKQKLILPIKLMGVVLIGIGVTMLINKLSGGSLNTGTMRHLGWFLIPVFIMTGIGCIGQALEWEKQS